MKTGNAKRLVLAKETVKPLAEQEMRQAAAGWWSESSCYCPPIY